MFNIKRQKHLYTFAPRHSHIQLYKTEKGDSLGKNCWLESLRVHQWYRLSVGVAATAMPNVEKLTGSKRHQTPRVLLYKNTKISFQCTQNYKSHFRIYSRNVDITPNNQRYCTIIYNKQFYKTFFSLPCAYHQWSNKTQNLHGETSVRKILFHNHTHLLKNK